MNLKENQIKELMDVIHLPSDNEISSISSSTWGYETSNITILTDGRIVSYDMEHNYSSKIFILYEENGNFIDKFEDNINKNHNIEVLKNGDIVSYYEKNKLGRFYDYNGHIDRARVHDRIIVFTLEDESYFWFGEEKEEDYYAFQYSKYKGVTFRGHTRGINGAKVLKNGNIISYSGDNTLKLWDSDGNLITNFKGHKDSVNGVLILENNEIISYSDDGTLRLWNLFGEQLMIYRSNSYVKIATILNEDKILSYSIDGVLKIWTLKTKFIDKNKTTKR